MNANADTVSQYPATLILSAGEHVQGTFLRLEKGRTRDGAERAIAVLEVDGAQRSLWLHERALRAQMRQLAPVAGELIRIEKGAEKKLGANGYSYWPFSASAPQRPAENLDWSDALLGDDDGAVSTGVAPQPPVTGRDEQDDDVPF
jgi:hypothetical protein